MFGFMSAKEQGEPEFALIGREMAVKRVWLSFSPATLMCR